VQGKSDRVYFEEGKGKNNIQSPHSPSTKNKPILYISESRVPGRKEKIDTNVTVIIKHTLREQIFPFRFTN